MWRPPSEKVGDDKASPSNFLDSLALGGGGIFLLFFGADILWIVFLRPWTES
jgi:hypothetical protein